MYKLLTVDNFKSIIYTEEVYMWTSVTLSWQAKTMPVWKIK